MKRSHIFLYPDHFKVCESSVYEGAFRYYGDAFFKYLVRHDLFTRYYHDQDDYKLLIRWISSYFEMYGILAGTGYLEPDGIELPPLSQSTYPYTGFNP